MSDKVTNRNQHPFYMTSNSLIDGGHIAIMGVHSFAVYSALMRHANTSHKCFPSYSCLQRETGMARSTISRAIAQLIELGYVRKLKTKQGKSNLYEIMEIPTVTSSGDELVAEVNQYRCATSTSSGDGLALVAEMDCKKTNRKRLIEKDSLRGEGKKDAHEETTSSKSSLVKIPKPIIATKTDCKNVPASSTSVFSSVEESDNFYAYAFTELLRDSKKPKPEIEDDARWMVWRLQKGKSDPRDRQYLNQFRGGLTRLSRYEEFSSLVDEVLGA